MFKSLVKKHVINYWEMKLRDEASPLTSLRLFHPQFMALATPHHIFLSASSSPYEVVKAGVQAIFLSGRYRTERLCRFWSKKPHGFCLLPSCADQEIHEDEEHILLSCGSLSSTRQTLSKFTLNYAKAFPHLSDILLTFTNPAHPDFFQFLLDCSALPQVISFEQLHGKESLHKLFKVTRTWCYSIHRDRLKMLGRWTHH